MRTIIYNPFAKKDFIEDKSYYKAYRLALARFNAVLCNSGVDVEEAKRKAGRPTKNFSDYIKQAIIKDEEDVERLIGNIRIVLGNRKGIEAARVIAAAMELGYIRRPSYAAVVSQFGKAITEKYYPIYIPEAREQRREDIFDPEILKPIKNELESLMR